MDSNTLTRNSIAAGSLKLLKGFERDPESRETIEVQIMSQHQTIGRWIMEKQLGVSRDQWGFWIVRDINSPEGKQYVMKMAYHDARDDDSSQKQGENIKDEALSYLFIRDVILAKKPYLGLNSCPPRDMYYEETVGNVTLRFLIMDYVEGTSWARVKSTLSIQENVAIAINVLDCLQALHAERHVFRDLHPDNVMLYKDAGKEDGQYRIKLIDYEALTYPEILVTADVAYVADYVSLNVLQTGQFTPYDDIETVLYMLDECLRGPRPRYPKIPFPDRRPKTGEPQAVWRKRWDEHDEGQNRILRNNFEEFYADSPLIELMRKLWSIERPPFKRDKKTWSEIPTLTLHEEVRSKMVMLMLSRMNLNLGSSCTIS
jgi:serine/threonine protein kinase